MGSEDVIRLVEETTLKMLETTEFTKLHVSQIAKACSISSRTFYKWCKSKNAVVNNIYTRHMEQYMNCSINEWYAQKLRYFVSNRSFFEHTLHYSGENCLANTIVSLEREKLGLHIKDEIEQDPKELTRTKIALEYMICGNLGALIHTVISLDRKPYVADPLYDYEGVWNELIDGINLTVLKNLSMTIVREWKANKSAE